MKMHKSITADLIMDAVERRMITLDNPGFCKPVEMSKRAGARCSELTNARLAAKSKSSVLKSCFWNSDLQSNGFNYRFL